MGLYQENIFDKIVYIKLVRFYLLFFRLDKCLYAYFVKKGMYETATTFANDVDLGTPADDCKLVFKFRLSFLKVVSM